MAGERCNHIAKVLAYRDERAYGHFHNSPPSPATANPLEALLPPLSSLKFNRIFVLDSSHSLGLSAYSGVFSLRVLEKYLPSICEALGSVPRTNL